MPAPLIPRLERLARLHNLLAEDRAQGSHGLPVGVLLEEMQCGRKALYRLVEELRDLDAPIQYIEDLHVWRYGHTWNFPVRLIYTVDGAVGMRLALDCLLDPNLERGLAGIVAIDPDLHSGKATLPRLTGRFSPDLLGPLARAIKDRYRVEFAYRKPREKSARRRTVEPLEIFEWNGMPYLQGREIGDESLDFKRFALSRLEDLEVLATKFRAPARTAVPSCLGAFCGTPFTAEIETDAEHAPYVRERQWHPKQKTFQNPDGSVRFTLPFGDHEEAARWVLGQGAGFRPLSPAPFVKAWKSAIAALSKSANRR